MAYNEIPVLYYYDADGNPVYSYRLEDDKTGDLYEGVRQDIVDPWGNYQTTYQPGQLIATNEALKNPDIQNFSGYNLRGSDNPIEKYLDPVQAQKFYELKQSNPTAYYNQLAADLGNQIAENIAWNKGEHNVGFTNQLNQIKEIDPAAYYKAQLNILGDSIGWQIGQNTSERNAPTLAKIQELAPEAMKAGLTADEINSLVNTSVNAGNSQNQIRIANAAASGGSGFNLGELVRGVAPIAAFAIGAPFLDAALAGGAAAGMAGNAGVGLGSSVPSLVGGLEVGTGSALAGTTAGAAAVPAGGALASLGSLGWTPPAIGGSAGFLAPTLGADVASTGIGLTAASVPSLTTGLELGASTSGLSSLLSNAKNLMTGAQVAKGLLGAGQNPLQAQAVGAPPMQTQQRQYAGVDYSPILNLLALKSPTRNTNSLLG